jgi:hypothetical protein
MQSIIGIVSSDTQREGYNWRHCLSMSIRKKMQIAFTYIVEVVWAMIRVQRKHIRKIFLLSVRNDDIRVKDEQKKSLLGDQMNIVNSFICSMSSNLPCFLPEMISSNNCLSTYCQTQLVRCQLRDTFCFVRLNTCVLSHAVVSNILKLTNLQFKKMKLKCKIIIQSRIGGMRIFLLGGSHHVCRKFFMTMFSYPWTNMLNRSACYA